MIPLKPTGVTSALNTFLNPSLEYLGVKLRDYLKKKIEGASTADLWIFIPAFSYYANFIAPVCHAIRKKQLARSGGAERHLNPTLDKLHILFPSFATTENTPNRVPVEVVAPKRPFILATPDFDAPALKLVDYPAMFETMLNIKSLLKIEDDVFSRSLFSVEPDFFTQLSDFRQNDEDNKSLIMLDRKTP